MNRHRMLARIFEVMCSDPRLAGSGILLEPFMLHSDELATPSLPFSRLDASWADGVRIFLTNSVVLALPILQWAYSRRLHIPEDLSLFAIDYAEEGALCVPPLTTVALPLAKLVELTIEGTSLQNRRKTVFSGNSGAVSDRSRQHIRMWKMS